MNEILDIYALRK